MDFLEKDLEEIIFNADREELSERGLVVNGKLLRQLRIGNYGVADLVEISKDHNVLEIAVYELKKGKIGISAFLQAVGYAKGLAQYLTFRNFKFETSIRIVLIGKEIDTKSTFSYLPDILPLTSDGNQFLTCYTYEYELTGIRFKEEVEYKLFNEGF